MRLSDLSGLMYASWSFLHSTRTPTSAEIQSCPLMSCIQEKSSLPAIDNCLNNWASCQPTLYPPLLNPFATSLLTLLKNSSTNGFLSARVLERFETFLLNLLASVDFLPAPLFEASAYLISLALLFVSAFSSSAAANRLLLPFVSLVCCAIRIHLWLSTISALFHQSVILAEKTQC